MAPNNPPDSVRVVFIVEDGAPVELMLFGEEFREGL
jgi:hypothetical protein